jgi:hypothetical protein
MLDRIRPGSVASQVTFFCSISTNLSLKNLVVFLDMTIQSVFQLKRLCAARHCALPNLLCLSFSVLEGIQIGMLHFYMAGEAAFIAVRGCASDDSAFKWASFRSFSLFLLIGFKHGRIVESHMVIHRRVMVHLAAVVARLGMLDLVQFSRGSGGMWSCSASIYIASQCLFHAHRSSA